MSFRKRESRLPMPYYPDFTPYSFMISTDQASAGLLNVGWLSRLHTFQKGEVEPRLLDALLRLCRARVRLTRGFHRCEFCKVFPVFMNIDGEKISLGNGEIRVPGAYGIAYAAPTLICHYIAEHEYRPAREFLEALAAL